MRLTDEEEDALRQLIDRFHDLYEALNKAEEKLNLLDRTRNLLTKQIEKLNTDINETRNIETTITEELVKKYGMFDIDLETFEITLKEETENE